MQGSTVKDDLAIARDWRSLLGIIVPSQPVRIDAYRAGNALMAMQTLPPAVQIKNHDLFARVQLLLKLLWCDACHSKFAHKAMPSNKLAAGIHSQCGEHNKDPKHAQSGGVRSSTIHVFAEDIAESGIKS